MAEPDPLPPGEAWMRGDLPSSVYFAMARRQAVPGPVRWRERVAAWWRRRRDAR